MKKLYPLLSVLFLIYWGCDDLFDPSVNLWGVDYSIENTTELYLLNSGLRGEIPPEIGNLTNLTFLDLHNNQLIGTIPPEIGNLTKLTSLRLDDNQLTGEIPSEIGNLNNLNFLFLDNNQLSGIIPDEICNQGDSSPSLSNNQLSPPYPSCIEDFVGEQFVELWGNNYSIENTTELVLFNNQLTGSIPPEIGNLINLTELVLFENQFTGSIPLEIGNLTNLTELLLFNNQLTGSIPPEIGNLTNLTELKLGSNQLTGEIPVSICDLNINWSNAHDLNISDNKLCPPYPSCIEDYVGEQDTSNCD